MPPDTPGASQLSLDALAARVDELEHRRGLQLDGFRAEFIRLADERSAQLDRIVEQLARIVERLDRPLAPEALMLTLELVDLIERAILDGDGREQLVSIDLLARRVEQVLRRSSLGDAL